MPICRRYLDEVVLVAEEQIASAMHFLVEGGGAVGVAALLQGALPRDETFTALVVSGGNVDAGTLRRIF